jgi:hypothetical protein
MTTIRRCCIHHVVVPLMVLTAAFPLCAADKSPGGSAFLKSLVVPGWGQYSLDRPNTALGFFSAELALIGGMLTLNAYGKSTRDDYRALATACAGVTGIRGHDFYVDVGNWMNVDQYNEQRLRDREFAALYTSPSDRWAWDSDQHRSQMETIRIRSDRAFNSILYLAGGLVLNHVASAIHAGRLAVQRQRQASALSPAGWAVDVTPMSKVTGVNVHFSHSF